MEQLTENDYVLLKYISRFQTVSIAQVEKHFSNKIESVAFRMSELKKEGYLVSCEKIIDDYENICEDSDIVAISSLGQTTVQDHFAKKKVDKQELWLKNVWIPIIVSFVTTVLTMHIVPKLPQILKWFFYTLSKIFSN